LIKSKKQDGQLLAEAARAAPIGGRGEGDARGVQRVGFRKPKEYGTTKTAMKKWRFGKKSVNKKPNRNGVLALGGKDQAK